MLNKTVIMGHHTKILDILQTHLEKWRIKYIRIDGNVAGVERAEAVNDFNTEKKIKVALVSITAGGWISK